MFEPRKRACIFVKITAQILASAEIIKASSTNSVDPDQTAPVKSRLFQLYLCLRWTSPNYAFMRCRLYSKQNV